MLILNAFANQKLRDYYKARMLKFSTQPIDQKIKDLNRDAEERDAKRRAEYEGFEYIDLSQEPIDRSALEIIPEPLAKEAQTVVFSKDNKVAKVATYSSESDDFAKVTLHLEEQKLKPEIYIASKSAIQKGLEHYAAIRPENQHEIVSEVSLSKGLIESKKNITSVEAAGEDLGLIDSETATTNALSTLLTDALNLKVSDIHLEPTKTKSTVRFRIDGTLYEINKIPTDLNSRLVGRLKLLASLKLNIKDQAQEGRFTLRRSGSKDVEVRISIVPSEYGEAVVMRLLDPETVAIGLNELGFREDDKAIVTQAIKRPNGIILTTGPTGSGKTTSLYAFLRERHSSEVKIITIEDPIEYHVDGIEQTQVKESEGYTFAAGLKSMLRQDPDVILVGEIRDAETANTAIDAALTGHLVFSTLHTNNAPGAIPRLIDLKVKPGSMVAALRLVAAQRLVRKLCEDCKKEILIDTEMKEKIQAFYENLPERVTTKPTPKLYQAVGCNNCTGGFRGRVGIFELLVFDEDFHNNLGQDISEAQVRKLARSKGMVYMQEDGVLKVLSGITTLEEVEKITGPVKWPAASVK